MSFNKLEGKVILSVGGCEKGSDRITIVCSDLTEFQLFHYQGCCENVLVEDVAGDPADLIGHRVALAEESVNRDNPPSEYSESFTWTFYRIRTHGGDLTIRWLGESNGYYGESVDVDVRQIPLESLSSESQVLRDSLLERGL